MYAHGRGSETTPSPFDKVRFGPLNFAAVATWLWSLNLIRISMGFLLLRLKDDRRWLWPLRVLVILQVAMLLVATAVHFCMCRPISAMWLPTADAQCISPDGMLKYVLVYDRESLPYLPTYLPVQLYLAHG